VKDKIKVLIGSCGGLTGVYIARQLRGNFFVKCEICGIDSNENIPTKKFLDKFFEVPSLENENCFIKILISVLNRENIDIYFPTHSKETYIISKNETYIRNNTKTKFIISPYDTYKLLGNKKIAYLTLKNMGLDVPKVYCKEDKIDKFPVFTKPEISSGSKNSFILYSNEEVELVKQKYPDNFFMEYVKGCEYTVDCIYSSSGEFISYNQRIRIKTLGGAAIITKNNFDVDFRNEIMKISDEHRIKGPCNFQFFYAGERKILTDINLRFASGGLPLTVESNVNIIEIMIKDMLGMKINKFDYTSDKKNRTMYRYFEEFYEVK
jgi:carbamoyl-phosphate synthase large subunit